jgi:hypothetical protein
MLCGAALLGVSTSVHAQTHKRARLGRACVEGPCDTLNAIFGPPGDYDGSSQTDYAVWRPSEGNWYIIPSSAPSTAIVQQWGTIGDIPMPGDYDGDGQTDFAVWRPSEGNWYVIPSMSPGTFITQQWGETGDTPVSGDFNGDGITDYAIWRLPAGSWFVLLSGTMGETEVQQWGTIGDVPVPGDYDGDGTTDFAVWRPSNGTWYVLPTSAPGTSWATQWGISTDEPVVDTAPAIGTSEASSATLRVPASASSELGAVKSTTREVAGGRAPDPLVRPLSEAGAVIRIRGERPVEEALKPVRYWLPEAFQRKIGNGAPEKEILPLSDLSRSIGVPAKASPEDVGKTNTLVVPSGEQKQP